MKNQKYLQDFFRFSSLNVLGMIGLSCYILADTYFISKGLGANGLTALNLAIPVYSFIYGCGLMIGIGGGTWYSILKSRDDDIGANRIFTHSLWMATAFSVCFIFVGLFYSAPIIRLFGAEESVFHMSKTYLQVILLFSPAFLMNNVLLCFVRNDRAPHLSMAAMIGGSFSNVILDWVFIFPCKMGIFGAVFATGLAPIISMLILSSHFISKNHQLHLIKSRPEIGLFISILSSGIPSLFAEVSSGIVMIVFNSIILHLQGNVGVAAYGVVANISLVIIAVYTGIAQGIQPILSHSYGAENHIAVKVTLRYALIAMLVISALIYPVLFFGAQQIAAVFNSEQNALLQTLAEEGLRLYFTACPFVGFNVILAIYFTSTGHPGPAQTISILRGFLLIIPMAFLLSRMSGILGVWCTLPATEFLVAVIGFILYLRLTGKHA